MSHVLSMLHCFNVASCSTAVSADNVSSVPLTIDRPKKHSVPAVDIALTGNMLVRLQFRLPHRHTITQINRLKFRSIARGFLAA